MILFVALLNCSCELLLYLVVLPFVTTDNRLVKSIVLLFILELHLCTHNMPSARTKRKRAKKWYASNEEDARAVRRNYAVNVDKSKEASKKLMLMIQKSLKRLQRKLTLMIRKSRKRLQRKLTLIIQKSSKRL